MKTLDPGGTYWAIELDDGFDSELYESHDAVGDGWQLWVYSTREGAQEWATKNFSHIERATPKSMTGREVLSHLGNRGHAERPHRPA